MRREPAEGAGDWEVEVVLDLLRAKRRHGHVHGPCVEAALAHRDGALWALQQQTQLPRLGPAVHNQDMRRYHGVPEDFRGAWQRVAGQGPELLRQQQRAGFGGGCDLLDHAEKDHRRLSSGRHALHVAALLVLERRARRRRGGRKGQVQERERGQGLGDGAVEPGLKRGCRDEAARPAGAGLSAAVAAAPWLVLQKRARQLAPQGCAASTGAAGREPAPLRHPLRGLAKPCLLHRAKALLGRNAVPQAGERVAAAVVLAAAARGV
mmetsp:Transcript_19177/g.55692  ORF Transcript_19177/g.55692 Transcript_19177/m.55692 type:complete len:265 (+) Transcript_19177:689-1483(+)